MKTTNPTSKRAQGYLWSMRRAMEKECNSLYKAYANPSSAKVQAYDNIKCRMLKQGLHKNLYVISHSCHFFTTGYVDGNDIIIDTAYDTYRIKNGVAYL